MLVWGVGLINNRDIIQHSLRRVFAPSSNDSSHATVHHADSAVPPDVDRILRVDIHVPQSRVTEAFELRGDVERLFARAFVVFVYHLWDESTRPTIADILGARDKDCIKADLMGDWRHLRNWIVHPNQDTENDYFSRATVLTRVLHLQRERPPIITVRSVMTLVDLLGAMQIRVNYNQ